jgi:serine acetyltransferase
VRPVIEQLSFLRYELARLTGRKPIRWLILFFEPGACVLISYRIDRCFHLLFGPVWTALRIFAFPLFLFLRIMSCRHEICFKANIGKGLWVVHPTLGVVVHGDAIAGRNLILTAKSAA